LLDGGGRAGLPLRLRRVHDPGRWLPAFHLGASRDRQCPRHYLRVGRRLGRATLRKRGGACSGREGRGRGRRLRRRLGTRLISFVGWVQLTINTLLAWIGG